MSVFDFIKKPTQQSTAVVNIAPQQVPVMPVVTATPPTEAEEKARQAYIANLLNKNPQVTKQVAQTPSNNIANPVAPIANGLPTETDKGIVGDESNQMARQTLLDIMTHLTQRSNKVFASAQSKAKEVQSEVVDSEHILSGLLLDSEIVKLLTDMKLPVAQIETALGQLYKRTKVATSPQISPRVKKIVEQSLVDARKSAMEYVSPEHILLALFEEGEGMGARLLAKMGVQADDLRKRVTAQVATQNQGHVNADGTITKPAETKKSALAEFTIDITAKAEKGELDPVVERSEEIERVVQVLSRRTKNNPALVGEPGVGKTAILEGLAQRIVAKQVPEIVMNKRILQLDLMSVLAGASHRGEFEQRMKDLIEEVVASNGKLIMFIDEMHTIIGAGAGGEGSLDAANFLKPALARGDLQMIGATTVTEYRKYIEKDPALERRFQMVQIPEPTEEAAIKMLKAIRPKYEKFHKVKIPDEAIEAAVKLSKRYVGDRFLPDKAIDLMDEAASAVRLPMMSLPEEIKSIEERIQQLHVDQQTADSKGDKVRSKILGNKIASIEPKLKEKQADYDIKKNQSTVEVSESIIKDVVSRWTGVPISKLSGSETDKLTNLEQIMHKRMIGQERAVKAVAAAVRRGRAGLKSNQRPIGSFIFLGPTGVGKTELTKTLAEVLFGQDDAMVRFDMTEFMEKHEVAKLLGPPPGYVGYEEGGKLTEAVRRKPYSVVLFDEVEKAHPDIFNILLQILDDGRLTDNKGRTISFKNTVVICTSNIGTQLIQDKLLSRAKTSDSLSDDSQVATLEVDAGKQSEKKVIALEGQSREYTDMKPTDIATEYKGAVANFKEPELLVGFEYEDEVEGGDMPSAQYNELKDLVMGELRKFFRPELINRFDEVIVFEPLVFKHMKKIVELQLRALAKLLEEQNLGLTLTDTAKEQVVIAGFDPIYGARPLRRAVQKLLENPISEMIIAKKAQDGDVIIVDYTNDFEFKVEKPGQVVSVNDHKPEERANNKVAIDLKGLESYANEVGHEMKAFVCIDSGYEFSTSIALNSTTICPINAKEKVRAVKHKQVAEDDGIKAAVVDLETKTDTQTDTAAQPDSTANYLNSYQATA